MPVQTRFRTTINGQISDIQTTCLLAAAPAFTAGFGTWERGTANEEDCYWGNLSGLQLTSMLRGLSKTALTVTEVSGNKRVHLNNAVFEACLLHYIVNNKADLDEDETISGNWTFTNAPRTPGLKDINGNETIDTPATASAVNQLKVINSATGDAVQITAAGGDTNIDVKASGKGTGKFIVQDGSETDTDAAPTQDKDLVNKKYVDNISNVGVFGDGSDGDVTIAAGTTTLTRDMFYDHLVINGNLVTKNWKVFCKTSITGNATGKLQNNGNAGGNGLIGDGAAGGGGSGTNIGGPGGAAIVGSLGTSLAGKTGGHGQTAAGALMTAGTTGADATNSLSNVTGGTGGTGGSGAAGAGAAGASGGTVTSVAIAGIKNIINALLFLDSGSGTGALYQGGAGAGSGGGGNEGNSCGGGSGGGSGGNAGNMLVAAPNMNFVAGFTIEMKGGKGGDGGSNTPVDGGGGNAGGGGAGGGGCGGIGLFICRNLTDASTKVVTGGLGGTGGGKAGTGTPGSNGTAGGDGQVFFLQF